jgi:hypothetical protein
MRAIIGSRLLRAADGCRPLCAHAPLSAGRCSAGLRRRASRRSDRRRPRTRFVAPGRAFAPAGTAVRRRSAAGGTRRSQCTTNPAHAYRRHLSTCPPGSPSRRPPRCTASFGREFRRVFNLRTVALVFYVCLAIVVGQLVSLQSSTTSASGRKRRDQPAPDADQRPAGARGRRRAGRVGAHCHRCRAASRVRPGHCCRGRGGAASAGVRLWVFGASLDETRWPWFVAWAAVDAGRRPGLRAGGLPRRKTKQPAPPWSSRRARSEALNAQVTQARLSALQAQIEPHFLFNTLANVKRLYETAPAAAAKCCPA